MDIIQLKRGKFSEWTAENPVLEAGEAGIVFDTETLVPIGLKVGNGFLTFNELPFITGGGTAETYTKTEIDSMFSIENDKIEVVRTDISTIRSLISSSATASNQLLSRSDVESLIAASGLAPTPAQLAAMNSGITSEILTNILDAVENIPSDSVSHSEMETYVEEHGGKIDKIQKNSVDIPIVNKVVNIAVPTKTSDLTNDSNFATTLDVNTVGIRIDNHISDKQNPHEVTKSQVGLGNVDNTSDLDKPVSNATQLAIADSQETLRGEIALKQNQIVGQNNYDTLLMTPPSSNGGQPGTIGRSTFALASSLEAEITRSTQADEALEAGKVDKIAGKGLSTEDFTSAEKIKLEGIESGAEVNIIESVKLNGSRVSVSNKEIDLGSLATGVSLGALSERVENIEADYLTSAAEATLEEEIALKQNSTDANLSTISKTVTGAINELDTAIDTINGKIMSGTTSENPLVNQSFVNSSIDNVAAYYITKNAAGDPFSTYAELAGASIFYWNGQPRTPTQNDYCIVLADESRYQYSAEAHTVYSEWVTTDEYVGYFIDLSGVKTEVTVANKDTLGIIPGTTVPYIRTTPTSRYSYQGSAWVFQYIINNSGLTASQLAALNSGITEDLVNATTSHISSTANPHGVTKSQVGLGNIDNVRQYSAENPNLSSQSPLMDDSTGSAGTATTYSHSDHRHPSDTSKVDKTLTIAGIDLQDNIPSSELTANLESVVVSTSGVGGSKGLMTPTQAEKLAGISAGAQVNILEGVQINGTDLEITNKKVNILTKTAYNSNNKLVTETDIQDFASQVIEQGTIRYSTDIGGGSRIKLQSGEYRYLKSNSFVEFDSTDITNYELKISETSGISQYSLKNFKVNSLPNSGKRIFFSDNAGYISPTTLDLEDCAFKAAGVRSALGEMKSPNAFQLNRSIFDFTFKVSSAQTTDDYPTGQSFTLLDSKFTFTKAASNTSEQGLVFNCKNSEVHLYDTVAPSTASNFAYEFRNCIDTTIYLHGYAKINFVNSTTAGGETINYTHSGCKVVLCKGYEYSPAEAFTNSEDTQIEVIDENRVGSYVVSIAGTDTASGKSVDKTLSWSVNLDNSFQQTISYTDHHKGWNGKLYAPKVKTYSKIGTGVGTYTFEEVYDSASININTGEITVYSDVNTPEYLVVID